MRKQTERQRERETGIKQSERDSETHGQFERGEVEE